MSTINPPPDIPPISDTTLKTFLQKLKTTVYQLWFNAPLTGSVTFDIGESSKVVTNALVTTGSRILATVGTNDTTMKTVLCVAAAGSFTIYANAAATAETTVNYAVYPA